MQIDFHHAVTYTAARIAGFDQPEAEVVAYAAQYVDDATRSGVVHFHNQAIYQRISSAHKMVDPRNAKALANHLVWIPFHFLPGNGGLAAGLNPEGGFIEKIICSPHGPIAEEMVRLVIVEQHRPYALHRLGVAMHVYADTWSHQGFAGVLHKVNDIEDAREISSSGVFDKGLKEILIDVLDDAVPPLGHGRANVFPDMPFLEWEYFDHRGRRVQRNNTDLFCDAADAMCKAMQRYRAADPDADVPGIGPDDMQKIRAQFLTRPTKDGHARHTTWLKAFKDGYFSFDAEEVAYAGKGKGSWKEQALGTNFDQNVTEYQPEFLRSNWKLFHDALQAHRFYVIHDLLPKYGICAA